MEEAPGGNISERLPFADLRSGDGTFRMSADISAKLDSESSVKLVKINHRSQSTHVSLTT